MNTNHGRFKCSTCTKAFWDKDDVNDHMKREHIVISIKCKLCDYTSNTVAGLGKHKQEKHVFKCGQCKWTANDKELLSRHLDQVHTVKQPENFDEICVDNTQTKNVNEEMADMEVNVVNLDSSQNDDDDSEKETSMEMENRRLKKELKFMKNRFDQVIEDRNEVLKDLEEIKKKYEVELAEVREDFRKEKAEREHLRVRNTLLQDMSKIIVDKCLKPEKTASKTNREEEIETLDYAEIVRNKNKGYHRVSPADRSEKVSERRNLRNPDIPSNERVRNIDDDNKIYEDKSHERTQYCHFYNNAGRCLFEERFGKQCKFAHKLAPVCNYDRQCDRPKCMYRHTLQSDNF